MVLKWLNGEREMVFWWLLVEEEFGDLHIGRMDPDGNRLPTGLVLGHMFNMNHKLLSGHLEDFPLIK